MVITTAPGEEAQVDYGEGPMVRDAATGKYRRTRLFVLTLGYSRKSVRLLVAKSSTRIWAELHERAFRRLGGAPRIVVLDNLREGVLAPDVYDPTLNPLYRDVLAHYGVVALPCRVRDPDRKGKVESGVGHAQRTPLQGLRFEIDRGGAGVPRSLGDQLGRHAHPRHDEAAGRGDVCRGEAAPAAAAGRAVSLLPVRRATVHLDGCVEVEAAYYGAPPGWIGRRVRVQWDGARVRLLDPATGQLLREHLRQERGRHRIHRDDKPSQTPATTVQLLHARCATPATTSAPLRPDPPRRRRDRREARSWACWRWRRSTAPPTVDDAAQGRNRARRARATASCAATSSAGPPRR